MPYEPCAHELQVVAWLAGEYCPLMQVMQGPGEPVALEKVPARQGWQVLGSIAARAAEYVPGAQAVQAESPVVLAYVPAAQSMHGLSVDMMGMLAPAPFEEVYVPTSQYRQADSPKKLLYWPGAQAWQVVRVVAPSVAEYVPGSHW
jgi:hypothetical protein